MMVESKDGGCWLEKKGYLYGGERDGVIGLTPGLRRWEGKTCSERKEKRRQGQKIAQIREGATTAAQGRVSALLSGGS